MAKTKLHPIVTIRPPLPEASHPPFSLFVTSDEQYDKAKAAGGISNILRYKLDNDLTSYFDDDEERKASRNRAVSLPYSLQDQSELSQLTAFETIPTPQEKAQLDYQANKYRVLRDELQAESTAATPDKPFPEEKKLLLNSYREQVAACELAQSVVGNQLGFIEVIPDIFGYGGSCLHDLNNVPNVDKIRASTFTIPRDHPFHLALRFAVPNPEQRETDFQIAWGPFKLRIRGGGRVTLSMASLDFYQDGGALNLEAIAIGEAKLESLLDQGRITSQDVAYIESRETAIRLLQKRIRDEDIKPEVPLYAEINRAILGLREEIAARKKLKSKMPSGVQKQIDTIIKTQYAIYEERITLNESSENFYGDEGILRLTVLPQKRGYLTLVLNGKEPINIKIPEILKSKEYGTLWEETRLVLRSNGGAFDWKFLYPSIETEGEYRIPDVPLGFKLTEEELESLIVEGDWDTLSPGVQIFAKIEPALSFTEYDPRYDFVVTFVSNYVPDNAIGPYPANEYLPWLYSLRFFINAGEIPVNATELWTSKAFGAPGGKTLTPGHPNPNRDSPIRNAIYSADDITDSKRGQSLIVEINDPNNSIGFQSDGFKRCQIDISVAVWNETTKTISGETDVLQNGMIREATLMNARKLVNEETGEEIEIVEPAETHGPDSFWRLVVVDLLAQCEDFLIEHDIILDNLLLGAAIKRLAGVRGFQGVWTQFIDEEGNLAGPRLPKAGPGEKPRKAPRRGMNLLAAMLQLLEEFGVTDDDQELRLRVVGGTFALDTPNATLKANFSGDADYEGTHPVFAGASITQDWSRFYNIFTVNGGRDKITGKKLSVTLPILDSLYNEDSPIYLGHPKPMPPVDRPDLDTQEDVERAVEILAIRNTKSGHLRAFPTRWLYPLVPIGDTTGLDDNENFELARISNMSLLDQTSAEVVLRPIVSISF